MVPKFSSDEEERLRQKWEINAKGKYYNHPDLNYYYERMLGITDITNYDKELYSDTKVLDMDFLRKCRRSGPCPAVWNGSAAKRRRDGESEVLSIL